MSVLIKGIDMPKSCDECSLMTVDYGCVIVGAIGEAYGKRCEWCPLVEVPTPHGRLLDEDVILPKCHKKKGIIYIGNFAEIEAVIEAED